jgi:hypothetical protein
LPLPADARLGKSGCDLNVGHVDGVVKIVSRKGAKRKKEIRALALHQNAALAI